MFYGSNDEVIRERIALLGSDYQETLVDTPDTPSSNTITPILVNGADHRFTFISAAPLAKAWMDNLP
jgi:ribonuclease HII